MQVSNFAELAFTDVIAQALRDADFLTPTPIQAEAIPPLLDGRDVIACAATGTGKTAAFTLPMLQRLLAQPRRARARSARALVLTPTRELAGQVRDVVALLSKHAKIRSTIVVGGVNQRPQVRAMQKGVDVLVATPGRLQDLIEQGHITLDDVGMLVLDEADRMLDMGFLPAIKRIISLLPESFQTALFSATMDAPIMTLAKELLDRPVSVKVHQEEELSERLDDYVMFVGDGGKSQLLTRLLKGKERKRTLVFTRTKRRADRVARMLDKSSIPAKAIHGDKSQKAREAALKAFRNGRCDVLVATDVAARGIDVRDVTHVINFDLPMEAANYVHRIGRTARAGATGVAHSFCGSEEGELLRDIEKLIARCITVSTDHPYHAPEIAAAHQQMMRPARKKPQQQRQQARRQRRRSGRGSAKAKPKGARGARR